MHLGSAYLIVKDFNTSIDFYKKLLSMEVSKQNMQRFAMFEFEGQCIALMNAYFDHENPDKVIHKGEIDTYFDNMIEIANQPNSRKFVLDFWVDDLRTEYHRLVELGISNHITKVRYLNNASPYYYFQLTDPDGNIIEVTGNYVEGN